MAHTTEFALRKPIFAIRYTGGKSAGSPRGTGRWIAGLLPQSRTYTEPFAGMLGVLLQRPKSTVEIVNDRNSRLINWWRCLRDHTDELLRQTMMTPWSRELFTQAIARMDNPALTDIERASAFHTVILQGYRADDSVRTPGDWLIRYTDCNVPKNTEYLRLLAVADRVADVTIENRDAVELLDRLARIPDITTYCDPPYATSDEHRFYSDHVNLDDLTATLKAQKGNVAISGYGTEWDHLDWNRADRRSTCTLAREFGDTARTEVLWMNYPTTQPGLF